MKIYVALLSAENNKAQIIFAIHLMDKEVFRQQVEFEVGEIFQNSFNMTTERVEYNDTYKPIGHFWN